VAALLPAAELQFADANGVPYAGGTLATYIVGTTTPKATWSEPTGTALNANPIVLDAAGRAVIYGDGAYRTILSDAAGDVIWDQQSNTLVSLAMAPVCIAPTIAEAQRLLGIDPTAAADIAAEAAARAAADAALSNSITENVAILNADIVAETTRAEAAEAALAAEIAAIPAAVAPNVQGGVGVTDGTGHIRIVFPAAYAAACDACVVTSIAGGFFSIDASVVADRFGADVWLVQGGSPIPKPGADFFWLSLGH
jgi:hypothetical protein